MTENVDSLDLKILDSLGRYGPRNITDVARKMDIPAETLRKRLKRLRPQVFLKIYPSIYHTKLGLKKAIVLAQAIPGYENLLFKGLKINDFWIFMCRCYGINEGCAGIYTIPKQHCTEFERFLDRVQKLGIAKDVQVFWSTCLQTVNSKSNWFDQQVESWSFEWKKWVEEIPTKETKLPYTLVDPETFPIIGDKLDVLILKELEKDATISFADLAQILQVSPELIRYHFHKHIVERGLLEGFQVGAFHFGRANSDMFYFIFKFDTKKNMARFAVSLMDKPFALGLGKILRKNWLFGYLYFPKHEFRVFINCLSKLIKEGLLQSYQYVIHDLEKASRQTIPYEYFKDGSWIYNHQKHLVDLHSLVKETRPKYAWAER